jgi:hypothetical protein
MGICHYCGKPAGFLRHQHRACRQAHDDAAKKIPAFFVKALQSSISASRFRTLIEQDASQNYIANGERNELVRSGMGAMIRAAADGNMTDADDARIKEIQDAFGLTATDLGEDGRALTKMRILRALDAGRDSPINVSITGPLAPRMERDEKPIWAFDGARLLTTRTKTHYVGGSSGVSIRLARGLYYRASTYRGHPVQTQYLSNEDNGGLAITPRNLYFVGSHKALKMPIKKVASVHLYSDGIEVLENGVSKKPFVFQIDDPTFAANLLSRLHGN